MTTRREFLIGAGAGLVALGAGNGWSHPPSRWGSSGSSGQFQLDSPFVVSTWSHGLAANEEAWKTLQSGQTALDAVEAGVRVSEADPEVTSVGFGGHPDRDGHVTLDACIMDQSGNAGSVAFLEGIEHAISVARLVMEKTPHVMLVGEGARNFAMANDFPVKNLLTPESEKNWRKWQETADYQPWLHAADPNPGHDTISMLAIDGTGDMCGACTTSGLPYKMHGRVGDSPIIGAAMFVDNEVGGACATGVGEEVMKTLGSFLIVELMRQGLSPAEACHEAIARIVRRNPRWKEVQVGYLAADKQGRCGAFSIQPGFQFAVMDSTGNRLLDAQSWVRPAAKAQE